LKKKISYKEQEINTLNWERSIKERQRMIIELKRRGIVTPKDPREMKMEHIRKLLEKGSASGGSDRQEGKLHQAP
jgi:hypothetical protein